MALGGLLLLLGLSLVAGSSAALWGRGRTRGRRYGAIVFLLLGVGALATLVFGILQPLKDPNPALAHYRLAGAPLDLPDPGRPGPYKVRYLTYGGGTDRFRPEFAARASFRSHPVDGSKLDVGWKGTWGSWYAAFTGALTPKPFRCRAASGRREGKGPFPLVLIVHGNHNMERFSDPGYAYLGELRASQGFILVSVDENFLQQLDR